MENQRISWIDIAKGIGIICVVAGHCFVTEAIISRWIFSFHMPLFFFLSGYCFKFYKYDSLIKLIKSKSHTLILPYIYFWIVGFSITLLITEWRNKITFWGMIKDFYQAYPSLINNTSIWFLICLFIVTVVFYIIKKVAIWIKNPYIIPFLIVMSGLFGFLITVIKEILDKPLASGGFKMPGERLPLTIDTAMTALVFYAMGYYFEKVFIKNLEKIKKIKFGVLIIGILMGIISVFISLFLNSRVNLHGCRFGNIAYFYLGAVSGILFIIFVSFCLEKYLPSDSRLKRIIEYYGKRSLFMFGIQSLLLHLFILILNHCLDKEYILYEYLPTEYGIIAFIIVTFVCLPFIYWIYINVIRISKKFLIGERNEKN